MLDFYTPHTYLLNLGQFPYEEKFYKVFYKCFPNLSPTDADTDQYFNKALYEYLIENPEFSVLIKTIELATELKDYDTRKSARDALYCKIMNFPRSSVYEIIKRVK